MRRLGFGSGLGSVMVVFYVYWFRELFVDVNLEG